MPAMSDEDLVFMITRILREYLATGRRRTDLLREVADYIVELRSRHTTKAGATDWGGRSSAYRETIRSIYEEAGVTEDLLDGVQSALRYHVGNAIRQRADTASLQDAGIRTVATPRARKDSYRAAQLAVLATMPGGTELPPPRRVRLAEALLSSVAEPGTFDDLDNADLILVREKLDSIVVQVKTIRTELPKSRRSGG